MSKSIIVKKENLIIEDYDNGRMFQIIGHNGSGLYECIDESGNHNYLSRNEIKTMCKGCKTNIDLIDETLDFLKYKQFDMVYTDDMLNFIDRVQYEKLDEVEKGEYEQIEFITGDFSIEKNLDSAIEKVMEENQIQMDLPELEL